MDCRAGHVFCEQCIDGWFQEAQNNSCPVCRQVYASLRKCHRTSAGDWLKPKLSRAVTSKDKNQNNSTNTVEKSQRITSQRSRSNGVTDKDERATVRGWSGAACEPVEWAQCEAKGCGKWRVLPPHVKADMLPDQFRCSFSRRWYACKLVIVSCEVTPFSISLRKLSCLTMCS